MQQRIQLIFNLFHRRERKASEKKLKPETEKVEIFTLKLHTYRSKVLGSVRDLIVLISSN